MGTSKGSYKCPCGYETKEKGHMRRHINRKNPCEPNKKTRIDIETTFSGQKRIQEDISHLNSEEKKERFLKQCLNNTTKLHTLGNMTVNQLARKILGCIKNSTNRRKHEDVLWNVDDIVEILQKNKEYIIHDTILGSLIFPIILTNGYHNTPSFDRINDKKGYSIDNIEVRPHFLNTSFGKLTTQYLKDIVYIREQLQNENELINISKNINLKHSNNFFYYLAKCAKKSNNKTNRRKFEFDSLHECMVFYIKQYIKQGGRCAYSNIPIYPEIGHRFKISPERIDPRKNYSEDNLILITVGLNGPPSGQFLNKNLTEEQREIALESAKFNQEYWDKCTKMTPEIYKKCEESRIYGKQILLENLNNEIKKLIF